MANYRATSDGRVACIGDGPIPVLTVEQAMELSGCIATMAENARANPSMVALGWDRSWDLSAKACVEAAREAAEIRRSYEAAASLTTMTPLMSGLARIGGVA